MALLSASGLEVAYGPVRAVRGIDFVVEEGEIVVLLGTNGAGKSSTLNAVVSLVPIAAGTISLAGAPINGVPTERLVRLGLTLTPEGRRVFGSLSVEENLRLGGYALDHRAESIAANLERMFALFPILAERRHQLAGTLSGGQQQQLAIARSLMSSPRLLLLDEPSLGLAPQIVEAIFEHIVGLRNDGITVMLVEQNVAMSLEIADRGYVLASGEIVAQGTTDELKSSHLVEQAYLGQT